MKESNATLHPWQSGPSELLKYALNMLRESEDCQRRISFLLIDCCVETLLKTYLLLPEEVGKQSISFHDRRKAAQGNFHDLIEAIKKAAAGKLSSYNLSHIEFYHDIRNHLYHQGNGITVPDGNLFGYAKLAAALMKELLGVDFTNHPVLVPEKREELDELQEKLDSSLKKLSFAAQLLIETAEPRLVLPSRLEKMRRLCKDIDVCNFQSKIDEFINLIDTSIQDEIVKKWIKGLIADSTFESVQALSNAKYIFESLSDPTFFYLIIIGTFYLPDERIEKDDLWSEEDVSLTFDDEEYHIAGLYQTANVYRNHINQYPGNEPDSLLRVIEKNRELISKLDELSSKLTQWLKGQVRKR